MGAYRTSERALAEEVLGWLRPGMLCLADRGFYGFDFWELARATGAELAWRVNAKLGLPREQELEDGSYLSRVFDIKDRWRRRSEGVRVRVGGIHPGWGPRFPPSSGTGRGETSYRIITTILDPKAAPAKELAALYPERWEIESAFDELKTPSSGPADALAAARPPTWCGRSSMAS